jgi:large repetitive protein
MSRRRKEDINVSGTSFIDVFANTLGGLAFILIMVILLMGIQFSRPVINTMKLPDAYIGVPYEVWLSAAEGGGVYNWKIIEGELPKGVVMADTGKGYIKGIPQKNSNISGVYKIRVQVDAGQIDTGFVSTRDYVIQLNESPYGQLEIITGDTLPAALKGNDYSLTFAATGGKPPYTWSLISNNVKSVGFNSITGEVGGTISNDKGFFELVVHISDNFRNSADKKFVLEVVDNPEPCIHEPLIITTDTLPDALKGKKYKLSFTASGGYQPYKWQIDHSLAGFKNNVDGEISGLPAQLGSHRIYAIVTDAKGQKSTGKSFNLNVLLPAKEDMAPLQILSESKLPDMSAGTQINWAFSAIGGVEPYKWKLVNSSSDSLRINLSETGMLSCKFDYMGEYQISAVLSDNEGNEVSKKFSVNVTPAFKELNIDTDQLPYAVKGFQYNCMFAASGGYPPYKWSLESGLPGGITFTEGKISGLPETTWAGEVLLKCEDQIGSIITKKFDLEILESGQGAISKKLEIKTTLIPGLIVGEEYDIPLSVVGGVSPYNWILLRGALKSGLEFDNGSFSGKISSVSEDSVKVTISDSSGQQASKELLINSYRKVDFWWKPSTLIVILFALAILLWSIMVLRKLSKAKKYPLEIVTKSIPNARCSFEYQCHLSAIGGVQPYRWSIAEGELPDGLALSEDGKISGIPLKGIKLNNTKEFEFTVKVLDAVGNNALQKL